MNIFRYLNRNKISSWQIYLPFLIIANLAYSLNDLAGWTITLSFFLLVPGYLLLSILGQEIKSRWETLNFSLGLSLLILIVSGLLLNSFHFFGLSRPLTTTNIFLTLDVVTLALLLLNKDHRINIGINKLQTKISREYIIVLTSLSLLPLLAIGGAIRLNNGASNILTMILFLVIPITIIFLIWRQQLKPIYLYGLFTIALSVLFSTSLRGWYITGHDIQHEFGVFQSTYINNLWTMSSHKGDPFNACLSITILPTILCKLTTIPAVDIYKTVFQIIFAFGILPVYYLIRRFKDERMALLGGFLFITFPTFLNDMPFLNRQEIAFVFFSLLVLVTFTKLGNRLKTTLSILLLLGLILSHYSSAYVTICLLILGWAIYPVLRYRIKDRQKITLPALRLPFILLALLFAFIWNVQITASNSNLISTLESTAKGIISQSSDRNGFVEYSLLGAKTTGQSPSQVLASYTNTDTSDAQYVPWANLPLTRTGAYLSHYFNVNSFDYLLHSLSAKIFQVLLLIGVIITAFRRKNKSEIELYFSALVIACTVMLTLWTLLPQISIDYDPTRLFQQSLMIVALPMIIALEFIFSFFGKRKHLLAAMILAILFLNLSGFIPQSLGGYLPQLSLNNSGEYYDFFYSHKGEIASANWFKKYHSEGSQLYMDTTSSATYIDYPVNTNILGKDSDNGYLYQSYTNVQSTLYRLGSTSGLIEYSDPSLTVSRNLIYSNQDSRIYNRKSDY
jgi:uncharacterized membrane protein